MDADAGSQKEGRQLPHEHQQLRVLTSALADRQHEAKIVAQHKDPRIPIRIETNLLTPVAAPVLLLLLLLLLPLLLLLLLCLPTNPPAHGGK